MANFLVEVLGPALAVKTCPDQPQAFKKQPSVSMGKKHFFHLFF